MRRRGEEKGGGRERARDKEEDKEEDKKDDKKDDKEDDEDEDKEEEDKEEEEIGFLLLASNHAFFLLPFFPFSFSPFRAHYTQCARQNMNSSADKWWRVDRRERKGEGTNNNEIKQRNGTRKSGASLKRNTYRTSPKRKD